MSVLAPLPPVLPPEKQQVIGGLLQKLTRIPGIQAVVLGGSYAQGTPSPTSDVDLGLYYAEQTPFRIDAIRAVATEFSVQGEPVVTDFYEWGAWVNGGAWIQTTGGKVTLDYLQQPPYGFPSVIYLAETAICQPLYDPTGLLSALKQDVADYPPPMKAAIIQGNLWQVEFTLLHARAFASQGEVYNTVGCLTRMLSALTYVLFALNETYFITHKQAIKAIAAFAIRPSNYGTRVNRILGQPGTTAETLMETVEALTDLFQGIVGMADQWYQPKYKL